MHLQRHISAPTGRSIARLNSTLADELYASRAKPRGVDLTSVICRASRFLRKAVLWKLEISEQADIRLLQVNFVPITLIRARRCDRKHHVQKVPRLYFSIYRSPSPLYTYRCSGNTEESSYNGPSVRPANKVTAYTTLRVPMRNLESRPCNTGEIPHDLVSSRLLGFPW